MHYQLEVENKTIFMVSELTRYFIVNKSDMQHNDYIKQKFKVFIFCVSIYMMSIEMTRVVNFMEIITSIIFIWICQYFGSHAKNKLFFLNIMHKIKAKRFRQLFFDMLILQHHFAMLDLETANWHRWLTNFQKDWNKFPEIFRWKFPNSQP